jgi:D-3-phosphoglycerate dehydrogenase
MNRVNWAGKDKKRRILLLEGIHSGAKRALEAAGFHVEAEKSALQGKELISRAQGFHGIGIRSKTKLVESVIHELPELELIGCFCIGTDQVALTSAREFGVPVFNAPYSNTRSVAELMISEIIALSRRLTDRSAQMHRGVWQKSADGANEVRGKTLGIIGYGHIGSQLSVLAESLGLNVIFYDIVKKLPLGNAKLCNSLHELLQQSDFVSLHVPDTNETRNLMGKAEMSAMKAGSYLLNASRGEVVDLKALAEQLKSKHLAGAAIDVFPVEPDSNTDQFQMELQELDNVILTPHIGGSTQEAQESIGLEVAESIIRCFQWGATAGAVNFPQLDVTNPRGVGRIVNVHKNVPGVLGAVNGILSGAGANIIAQHLATDPKIGYLIMDIEGANVEKVSKDIAQLKTSIRTAFI